MKRLLEGCIAELIGVFLFVFMGAGSIIITHASLGSGASLVSIALAHGLALGVATTICMNVSGGQLNPAVSLGLVVVRKQGLIQAAAFIMAQLIGAAAAAGMWQLILGPAIANDPTSVKLGATIGSLTRGGDVAGVLGIEAILTFALMMAVLAGTVDPRAHRLGGFVVGLTVAACIMTAGPLTGASMNPARTFGPAACGGHWDMHWVYWAGPVLGAVLAAVIYRGMWHDPSRR